MFENHNLIFRKGLDLYFHFDYTCNTGVSRDILLDVRSCMVTSIKTIFFLNYTTLYLRLYFFFNAPSLVFAPYITDSLA